MVDIITVGAVATAIVGLVSAVLINNKYKTTKDAFLELVADLGDLLLIVQSTRFNQATPDEISRLAQKAEEVYYDLMKLGPGVQDILTDCEKRLNRG